jgi:uncharacterized membrane protein YcaP (DUF421 family)
MTAIIIIISVLVFLVIILLILFLIEKQKAQYFHNEWQQISTELNKLIENGAIDYRKMNKKH